MHLRCLRKILPIFRRTVTIKNASLLVLFYFYCLRNGSVVDMVFQNVLINYNETDIYIFNVFAANISSMCFGEQIYCIFLFCVAYYTHVKDLFNHLVSIYLYPA